MYQIKLFNKISESGLSHLDPADFTYSEDIAEYDGIIVRSAALHDDNAVVLGDVLAVCEIGRVEVGKAAF